MKSNVNHSQKRQNLSLDVIFILTICAALAVMVFLVFGDNGYFALQKKGNELRQIEAEYQLQLDRNRQLEEDIYNLKNDPRWIEKRAREEYKLVREGDIILKTDPDIPLPSSSKP